MCVVIHHSVHKFIVIGCWLFNVHTPSQNTISSKIQWVCVFKGKFTGQPHIQLESLWFPIDFPLNQSFERFAIGPWPELDISRLRWVAG
jgi:hypothetical protein